MASKPKDKRYTEEIDYTDWVHEHDEKEVDVTSLDSVIRQMQEGVGPMQAGRLAFVATKRGDCVEPVLKHTSKYHLNIGLAQDISAQVAAKAVATRLTNGNMVKHREYVGSVISDDAIAETDNELLNQPITIDDIKLVKASDQEGVDRAVKYMRDRIPGYVRGRLVIIAANGTPQAVRDAAEELKGTIDDIVAALI